MKTIKKHIDKSIIGKECYDLIFEDIDKITITHKGIEIYGKDEPLNTRDSIFMATLLLIEEVNNMYSLCTDKEEKDMLKRAITMLNNLVNGGGKNGNKRNKGRNNKKYPKNR